jgi:hypothetical protein
VSGDNKAFVWAVAMTCSAIAVIASWIGGYQMYDVYQRGETARNQETQRAETDRVHYNRPLCQCKGDCGQCDQCKGAGCCRKGK